MESKLFIKLGLVLFALCFVFDRSESAVSSIDLGSEWGKVAVVNLKPGQSPISIAINEMSKRKSPALVAFHSGTRLLGEEAAGIVARYPEKVYSQVRDMLGKPYGYVKKVLDSMYLPFDIVEDSRGAVSFKVDGGGDDGVAVYSVEELLAMILGYAADLAEFHSKVPVKDAVIAVPPYFGQAERRGLIQAAQLAGINVLSLINEYSGAALQYGIDKDFSNESRHVIFYDMGSSSTYAALVYYSAYNAKEFGKTVSVNQFQVKEVRWDPELGGQNLELRLVEYFADEFNKQVGNGVDVRKSAKAMAKLKKQVKRTKEILSANTAAPISVESLYDDRDFRWDPELGGQNLELRLVEYFADEFNKQVGNGVDVRKSAKAMAKLKKQVKRTKEILSANTAAPISVESLYDDRDFRSTITREKFEELCQDLWEKSLIPVKEVLQHSGLKLDEIYAVELIGGSTRVPKLQAKLQEFLGRKELDKHLDADEAIVLGAALHAANLSDGIKLNRKLGMVDGSSYGLVFELDGPELLKDESTRQLLVQRMKKLPSKMFRSIIHKKDFEVSLSYDKDLLPPGVTSPIFAQYDVSGLTDASEKYSSRNLSSPIKANLHFSLSRSGILSLDRADAVIEISEWVEVPKKNLTLENSTTASPNLSIEAGANSANNASEEINDDLHVDGGISNSSNSNIVEKTLGPGMSLSKESFVEAKRRLEALDKKDAERRRTAELKNNLEGYIYATKEKLETSEEFEQISTAEERESFKEKLDELTARPAAAEHARRYLVELQQIVQGWETKKPWLPKDKIDEVISDADKFKTWLDEKEAEQKRISGFSAPVFTSEEVYMKVFTLQDKVSSINRIPKPKPKIEKPTKNETESSGDNVTNPNSTSEENLNQSDESSKDSDGSSNEKVDPESKAHSSNEKVDSESKAHDEL
ncbi:heat shock 70 kda protein 17 [Quercus suber]|uniref:Heat shock 70 kDa protein 17 n=2 Tax=Quercus suber TaxID=58331 RepID=A0AAW0K1P3_QUESU